MLILNNFPRSLDRKVIIKWQLTDRKRQNQNATGMIDLIEYHDLYHDALVES